MSLKGSKLYSILTGRCPRCQEEPMYVNPNPYVITETMKMHEQCSRCGLRYKIEPNFFFGAMYVSYALAVAVGMLLFGVSFLLFGAGLMTSFIVILVVLFALMPAVARLSRNIYINFFIHYDPNASRKASE